MADVAAPLTSWHRVEQEEMHVGEIRRVPDDAFSCARHPPEPCDRQREVVQGKDPQYTADVEAPQRDPGRRLAAVPQRSGAQENAGDEKPAENEEHPHADPAEVHVLTNGSPEV